jgi:ribonuclease HII
MKDSTQGPSPEGVSKPTRPAKKILNKIAKLSKRVSKKQIDWCSYSPHPIIGVDEVGRGCLAGPVVAAAVCLFLPDFSKKSFRRLRGFTDSKLMSEVRREELAATIRAEHRWSVAFASVEEIDELNIFHASLLAMRRAVEGLGMEAGHILVDGKFTIPGLGDRQQTALVKGDLRAKPISAASIVAKVARDRWMKLFAESYPGYGFEIHKGYATDFHRSKLEELGACDIHRRSFARIGETWGTNRISRAQAARIPRLDDALS